MWILSKGSRNVNTTGTIQSTYRFFCRENLEDAPNLNSPDEYDGSDNSSERSEGLLAAEPYLNTPVLDTERRRDFLRNSEALEEFREGLLDFSIAMENAARNRMKAHQEPAISIKVRAFNALKRVQMDWTCVLRFLRKAIRPSVKPGMGRIEWICVSGPHPSTWHNTDDED